MTPFYFAASAAFACGMAAGSMKSWNLWAPFALVSGLAVGALGRFWGIA